MRRLLADEKGLDERLARVVEGLAEKHGLTPREAEILSLVVADIPRQEIIERLGVTKWTFKNHSRSLLRKCGAARLDDLRRTVLQIARGRP